MIIGTAGHIDHGKTALVRALTGIDTDRLPEEKRRGISIELGFASLDVPGVGRVGIVDVPGHEAFVRTMVAGATGIDVALLVVAADDGVKPQTREHVAVLDVLGVARGVVALTKSDLASAERCAHVATDIAALLAETMLEGAPIIPVSAVSGDGLDALRAALAGTLADTLAQTHAHADARPDARRVSIDPGSADFVRLPIDRVFSKPGAGTVVTGTLWSGALMPGDEVTLLTAGRRARVRAIQVHGQAVPRAVAGTRVAVALAGVDRSGAARGDVLVRGGAWAPASVLRADVLLLPDAPRVGPRTRVRVHLGTRDVGARIVSAHGAPGAGQMRAVRVALDEPVVARGGDRFVLRHASPAATIGGGVVTDAIPSRARTRPFASPGMSIADRFEQMVRESGLDGVTEAALAIRLGAAPDAIHALAGDATRYVSLSEAVFARGAVEHAADAVMDWLAEYHARHEQAPGAPIEAARAVLKAAPIVVDHVFRLLAETGRARVAGTVFARTGWRAAGQDAAAAFRETVLTLLESAGPAVPALGELERSAGAPVLVAVRQLQRDAQVVALTRDRYAAASTAKQFWDRLASDLSPRRTYTPSELRSVFGVSRQYVMAWLEYFDRLGLSRREGDGRRFPGARGGPA